MKKTILSLSIIIFVVLFMFMGVMTVDLELNLKIRRKINSLIKPYEIVAVDPSAIYLSKEMAAIDEHSDLVIEQKNNTGDTYLNITHLNSGGITYSFDFNHQILTIVGADSHLWINAEGNVVENGNPIDQQVALLEIEGDWYINLTELNALKSGKNLGFTEMYSDKSGHIIIRNAYESYTSTVLNDETWVFDTREQLETYQKNQFELSFLYNIRHILLKTQISGLVKREEAVVYTIDDNSWYVVSNSGEAGYIAAKDASQLTTKSEMEPAKHKSLNTKYTEPIVMTWEAVYSYNPDTTKIVDMGELDVVSPTWYALEDANGDISSKVSEEYLAWAKTRRYEVWALVSNAFDIDRTHTFLADANARKKFIDYMIDEALMFGYSGINMDFENVYLEDRDALTHFVNEFAFYCHQNNIVLSMDVTVMGGSDNWSKCYDHQKLGEIVDFLVIMAYDEYWASSPISGPVASYDWVLEHMEALVQVVPGDKLIMGIPLYTRVWREYPSSEIANRYTTDSSAIGMEAQNAFVEKYELTPMWDDTDKLYYATFFEENAQVKIWIENAETIGAKLNIVNDLNLKGVAAWRRGFETPDIWQVFDKLNP